MEPAIATNAPQSLSAPRWLSRQRAPTPGKSRLDLVDRVSEGHSNQDLAVVARLPKTDVYLSCRSQHSPPDLPT